MSIFRRLTCVHIEDKEDEEDEDEEDEDKEEAEDGFHEVDLSPQKSFESAPVAHFYLENPVKANGIQDVPDTLQFIDDILEHIEPYLETLEKQFMFLLHFHSHLNHNMKYDMRQIIKMRQIHSYWKTQYKLLNGRASNNRCGQEQSLLRKDQDNKSC